MKIKNTAKFIISVEGEAILPGKISTNSVERSASLDVFAKQGYVEYITESESPAQPKDEGQSETEEETIRTIKNMRSETKLREKAAELGIEISDADDVATIKEKLVAHYEAQ